MRSPRSDFRDDRDNNLDMPEIDDKPRWPYRRRHFPAPRPRGFYAEYSDQLITENRSKREAEQRLPLDKAA
jgi:hypothetical protein